MKTFKRAIIYDARLFWDNAGPDETYHTQDDIFCPQNGNSIRLKSAEQRFNFSFLTLFHRTLLLAGTFRHEVGRHSLSDVSGRLLVHSYDRISIRGPENRTTGQLLVRT